MLKVKDRYCSKLCSTDVSNCTTEGISDLTAKMPQSSNVNISSRTAEPGHLLTQYVPVSQAYSGPPG